MRFPSDISDLIISKTDYLVFSSNTPSFLILFFLRLYTDFNLLSATFVIAIALVIAILGFSFTQMKASSCSTGSS